MRRRTVCSSLIGVLLVATALFLTACGGDQQSTAGTATTVSTASGDAQTTSTLSSATTQAAGASTVKADLTWGTTSAGGAFQVVGSAMLEDISKANPGIKGSILPTEVIANVAGVHEGKFNIAFSLSDVTAMASKGEGDFATTGPIDDLRSVASLYPQVSQIIVWADSGIDGVEGLKGKRVSPGGRGLSGDVEGKRLVAKYGMDWTKDLKAQYLSFNDAVEAMTDGRLDALMLTSPFPFAPVITLASKKPIKFLSLRQDVIDAMTTEYPGVEAMDMPAGIYQGQDAPVKCIALRAQIIVRKDMPDDVVYAITKSIYENFDRYATVISVMKQSPKAELARESIIPYHPGALKFYKEVGLVK